MMKKIAVEKDKFIVIGIVIVTAIVVNVIDKVQTPKFTSIEIPKSEIYANRMAEET